MYGGFNFVFLFLLEYLFICRFCFVRVLDSFLCNNRDL